MKKKKKKMKIIYFFQNQKIRITNFYKVQMMMIWKIQNLLKMKKKSFTILDAVIQKLKKKKNLAK